MLADLRPEEQLCCLLCRPILLESELGLARSLVGAGLDWQLVLDLACEHRIVGFLHHHLSQTLAAALPHDFHLQLRAIALANARKSQAMAEELAAILDSLSVAGITAVPYKGPLLVKRIWGDYRLGAHFDLDILVKSGDLTRARALLEQRAYRPVPGRQANLPPEDLAYEPLLQERQHVLGFPVVVDLHTRTVPHWIGSPRRADRLWERLQPADLHGTAIRALSDDWNLTLLALHVLHHGFTRLHWVAEFHGLARSCPQAWPDALKRASEIGARPEVLFAREVCDAILDGRPYAANGTKRTVARMTRQPFRGRVYSKKDVRLQLAIRRRLGAKLAYLFVPRPIDHAYIPLPRWLRPPFCIVRCVRLAVMYGMIPLFNAAWRSAAGRVRDAEGKVTDTEGDPARRSAPYSGDK